MLLLLFFFFNDTATTEIYTLSLHDALPILRPSPSKSPETFVGLTLRLLASCSTSGLTGAKRSEEHTSELQSRLHLVCRLLLEKKKKNTMNSTDTRRECRSSHRIEFAACMIA